MSRLSRIAMAAVLAVSLAAAGGPAVSAAAAAKSPLRSVRIIAPRWVYLDGDVPVGVRVTTRGSKGNVQAELDLVDSSGISRWHAVQTRSDLGSVTYEYSFFRHISEIGLTAGVYTLRTRVSGPAARVIERSASIIVVDRAVRPVPVCVVVRVTGTPSAGTSAPASETAASRLSASDAADLGRLAVLHPELRLSIAVPPYLLDEWRAAARTDEDTASPGPWTDALDSLRRASQAGAPILRGLYGDPDLDGIASAPEGLALQLAAGDAAIKAVCSGADVVPSAIATGLAASSGPLPAAAAAGLAHLGIRFAVVETASVLPANNAAATPGPYAGAVPARTGSTASTLTLLAVDPIGTRALRDTRGANALAADLFDRASSDRPTRAAILEVTIGPDGMRASALEETLASLADLPWIRFVDAPEAASGSGLPKAALRTSAADVAAAPSGYWSTIDRARERVAGLVAAAGAADPVAALALHRLLLAESRAWAGADGEWANAARGLALAQAADKAAEGILSKVALDVPAVTLSGSDGSVPVSVTNSSGRALDVVLEASSNEVRVRKARTAVRLEPGETILTVPVALGTEPSGRLKVAVTAGPFQIATSTAMVRASYQDRIVMLATVVLILVGLLFYIRRRMALASGARSSTSGSDDAEPLDV